MTWETTSLGGVAQVIRGVSFDKGEAVDEQRDGYVPILRAGNIDSDLNIINDLVWVPEGRVSSEQRMRVGDIAICMSSGSQSVVGKTASLYSPWDGSVGAFCAIVRPAPSLILPDFLGFFLRSEIFRTWTRQSSGANIKNIRKSELEAFQVPLPPIDEQRRMVDLLSRAAGIVRLRREAQNKAQSILPALFIDMFGDPATNPKGWDVRSVGDVLAAADYGSSSKASESGEGLPLIRMGNVTYGGDLDLSDLKHVNLPENEVDRYGLRSGDILFNRTNSKELVGKTGLWAGAFEAIAASYFIRLRVDESIARPTFLWAFMNTKYMKRVLFDTARGAIGQANINSRELRSFRVPLPPMPLQERFEARCRDLRSLQVQQDLSSVKAEATFNALLGRVFSQQIGLGERKFDEVAA